ncbi:MAG: hypothetical protein KAX16_05920 [Actinomycetia bacterium]|nr:hypothetical protein [Actinomycetes bacterium]
MTTPIITFFGVPKPFKGSIGVIQRNAIQSWCALKPLADVVLLGNESGCSQTAKDLGIRQIKNIEVNEYGTPLVSAIFRTAEAETSSNLICYLNSDIMLTRDFLSAINVVSSKWDRFLLVGRRRDIDLNVPWDFTQPDSEIKLLKYVNKKSELHSVWGIDYFVFPRGLWGEIPPFALGRPSYDNWLIYKARALGVPVIDATETITAIHQNHDYGHFKGGKQTFLEGPETKRNIALAGGQKYFFSLADSTWFLTSDGLKRYSNLTYLRKWLYRLPALSPRLSLLITPLLHMIRRPKNAAKQANRNKF